MHSSNECNAHFVFHFVTSFLPNCSGISILPVLFDRHIHPTNVVHRVSFCIDHLLAFPYVCVPTHCAGCDSFSSGLDRSSFHNCRHKSSYWSHGHGLSCIWPASVQLLLSLRCSEVCAWTASEPLDDSTAIVSTAFFQTISGTHSCAIASAFFRTLSCAFYALSDCWDTQLPNGCSTVPKSGCVVGDLMQLTRQIGEETRESEWENPSFVTPLSNKSCVKNGFCSWREILKTV